jgi:hypothetical protein
MDGTSPPCDEDSDEGPVRGDLVSVRQDLLFGPSVASVSKTRRAAAVSRHQAFMVSKALDACVLPTPAEDSSDEDMPLEIPCFIQEAIDSN